MPDLYRHIKTLNIPWSLLVMKWFVCLFAEVFPTEVCWLIPPSIRIRYCKRFYGLNSVVFIGIFVWTIILSHCWNQFFFLKKSSPNSTHPFVFNFSTFFIRRYYFCIIADVTLIWFNWHRYNVRHNVWRSHKVFFSSSNKYRSRNWKLRKHYFE